MTSESDICNMALGEMGARSTIASLSDPSPEGLYWSLYFRPLRQQLLRTARWAFARKTAQMSLLGTQFANPPTCPVPWQFKYAYPSDCLSVRYVLPPPPQLSTSTDPAVGQQFYVPWCPPSREFRFLVAYDDVSSENPTATAAQRVILSNVGFNGQTGPLGGGLIVYTVDVTDPDLWDSLFLEAMVKGLADKLVVPLSGDIKLKQSFAQLGQAAILNARVADGNESITKTDAPVDWMQARGVGSPFGYGPGGGGFGFGDMGQGDWLGGYGGTPWGS